MILFLDNQRSIGPNAAAGRFAGFGLNEKFWGARFFELHTLGVGSGYTQADVTELARALTGWSVAEAGSESGVPGAFAFKPNWHEPGERAVLRKHYAAPGVEQGREALEDMARHPATARHIATKLARHFVADDPPPGLADALARQFEESDGDLKAVAEALVSDDRAWPAKPSKARTPLEFYVAAARATRFSPSDPGPYQDHDARGPRVHPPLPPPRAAERLPPHPPLRPVRRRGAGGQHRARPTTARRGRECAPAFARGRQSG